MWEGNKTFIIILGISTEFPGNALKDNPELPGGFLDARTYYYILMILQVFVNPILSIIMFITCLINISTFLQMDLSQGVTLNLLILSCSDTVLAIVGLTSCFGFVMLLYGHYFILGVSIQSLVYACLFTINYPMYTSLVVTTVIAIVRCLSVVMPLSFRNVATPRRQLIIIAIISLFSIGIPLYTQIRAGISAPSRNVSQGTFGGASNQQMAMFDIFRNIFFYSCLSIIITAMFFLIFALKKSSKFQALASSTKTDGKHSKTVNTRETQIVKTIIVILAIFVICNLPLNLLAIMRQTIPGFSDTGRFRLEKKVWDMIVWIGLAFNCGLNVLAYYFTNSSYRKTLNSNVRHLLCSSSEKFVQ
ncbi:hypothetical protein RRG08_039095 [Elysia crispata]|uniref:G-protein coupled receptors family 1 profile domain-containing protein n=1 Tax=Elysia crispata TaxID=231223 RepID=A0AAE1DJ09_9GAST|nr:hypothetical protein RRG08_039095 [Elysia crispata]